MLTQLLQSKREMIGQNAIGDIETCSEEPSGKKTFARITLSFFLGISLFALLIATVRYTDELYRLEREKKNDELEKTLIPQPIGRSTEGEGVSSTEQSVGLGNGDSTGDANGRTSSDVLTNTGGDRKTGAGATVIENLENSEELVVGSLEEIRADGRDEQGRCRQENGKLCASNTNNVARRRNKTPDERTSPETPTTTKLLDNSKNRRKRWLGIRMLLA